MVTGVLARAALISAIYQRGVILTGSSRAKFSNSAIVNHISTDVRCLIFYPYPSFILIPITCTPNQVSRIDYAAQWFVSGILSSPCAAFQMITN